MSLPRLIRQPVPVAAEPGFTVRLFVLAQSDNGALSYAWERDTGSGFAALVNGGRVSGATSAFLVIADAEAGDAGQYRCVVTNTTGDSTTNSVNVSVADYGFDPGEDHEPPAAGTAVYSPAGSGSPEGVYYGLQGQSFWRTDNNTLYMKDSAGWGNTGWVLQVGGGGGAENQSGAGTPVGSATPDYIGQFYLDTTNPFNVWISTGLTNADWLEVVGGLT